MLKSPPSAPDVTAAMPEPEPERVERVEVIEPKKEVPPPPKPAAAEETVQQAGKEREVAATLRVDVSRIDKVMDLAGEIVLARNRLLNLAAKLESQYSGDQSVESLLETTSFLDRVTSDLQLAVMKMRMQQIAKVFSKFPRMVRDLSRALGKDIDLEIYGEETEVDKSVIENIGDPMVHIIRNSIDHGLEMNDEREAKGKPRNGRIHHQRIPAGDPDRHRSDRRRTGH
jgi:two-component system chemotaxis sensor kinase CheA